MEAYLYIIASILLAGSLPVLRDLPVVNGSILASGAGERLSIRYLWPLLMLSCLILPFFIDYSPVSDTAAGLYLPDSTRLVLPVGLATAGASMIAGLFCRFPAVPYAFIASLAGVSLALKGSINRYLQALCHFLPQPDNPSCYLGCETAGSFHPGIVPASGSIFIE